MARRKKALSAEVETLVLDEPVEETTANAEEFDAPEDEGAEVEDAGEASVGNDETEEEVDNADEIVAEESPVEVEEASNEIDALLEEMSQPKEVDPFSQKLAEMNAYVSGLNEQVESLTTQLSSVQAQYANSTIQLAAAMKIVHAMGARLDALEGEPIVSETVQISQMQVGRSPRPSQSFAAATVSGPVAAKKKEQKGRRIDLIARRNAAILGNGAR